MLTCKACVQELRRCPEMGGLWNLSNASSRCSLTPPKILVLVIDASRFATMDHEPKTLKIIWNEGLGARLRRSPVVLGQAASTHCITEKPQPQHKMPWANRVSNTSLKRGGGRADLQSTISFSCIQCL